MNAGGIPLSTARGRILVVSDTLALANKLLMWLKDAGHDPAVVTTFSAAKERLRTAPDVLITELKLREYNGLHLALRANRDGIPTAVIGADLRYKADAQEIGASYVVGDDVHRDDILLLVDGLLSARTARSAAGVTWPVTPVPDPAEEIPPADDQWQVELPSARREAASPSQRRLVVH
jgi:DNA-binding NtrC family response regulator